MKTKTKGIGNGMKTRKGENDDSWAPDVLSWKYALVKIVAAASGH